MDYRTIIKDEAKNRDITISKLCLMAKVPKEAIFRYLHKDVSIHHKTLDKLMEFCGYEFKKRKIKKASNK